MYPSTPSSTEIYWSFSLLLKPPTVIDWILIPATKDVYCIILYCIYIYYILYVYYTYIYILHKTGLRVDLGFSARGPKRLKHVLLGQIPGIVLLKISGKWMFVLQKYWQFRGFNPSEKYGSQFDGVKSC